MAHKQIGTIGDIHPFTYGGGLIYQTDTGDALLEYIEPPEDSEFEKPGAYWTVYVVQLDREIPDWGNIADVARSTGQSYMDLAKEFLSADIIDRARAYETWAGYYGWHEFDHYPRQLGRGDILIQYNEDDYPLMPTVREPNWTDGPAANQITVGGYVLDDAYQLGQAGARVYEEIATLATSSRPLENYFVLSFSNIPQPYVRLAYYEPEASKENAPLKVVKVTGKKFAREFPNFDQISPEEMLRRMSKWVP